MSYEPTNWKAGDTITSAKLNKLEQGLGNAITFVHMSEVEVPDDNEDDSGTIEIKTNSDPIYKLDKTYAEIAEAFENGLVLCIKEIPYENYNGKILCKVIQLLDAPLYNMYMILIKDEFHGYETIFYSNTPTGELTTEEPQSGSDDSGDHYEDK